VTKLANLYRKHRRFLAFCLVGGSGVFVNMAVFAVVLLFWPGAERAEETGAGSAAVNVAALAGWVVSVATNFVLNDRLTFGDKVAGLDTSWRRRLARYYISAAVALAMQLAVLNTLLWLMLQGPIATQLADLAAGTGVVAWAFGLALHYVRAFGNLCGIAAGTIANYLLADRWVFN